GTANFSQFMQTRGFRGAGSDYTDGPFRSVDWTDRATLQSAIHSHGPVKIGIEASLRQGSPSGGVTPGINGLALYACPAGPAEVRCASLCGYGTLSQLVELFRLQDVAVALPTGMPTERCYALFVFGSIGIIDEASMLGVTSEAWVRVPVTVVRNGVP